MATSGELNEYIRAFEALDTGHDGVISIKEMKECLKQYPGLGIRIDDNDTWDEILDSMDTNGDGQIDFNEFLAASYDR